MTKGAIEIIVDVMDKKGVSNSQLGDRIAVKNTAIWDRLNNKNRKGLKVDTMQQMLKAMDYTLVAIPTEKRKSLPEGSYELE